MTRGRELVEGETHAGHMASHVFICIRGDWCMALEVTCVIHISMPHACHVEVKWLMVWLYIWTSTSVLVQFVEERKREGKGKGRKGKEKGRKEKRNRGKKREKKRIKEKKKEEERKEEKKMKKCHAVSRLGRQRTQNSTTRGRFLLLRLIYAYGPRNGLTILPHFRMNLRCVWYGCCCVMGQRPVSWRFWTVRDRTLCSGTEKSRAE